MVTDKPRSNRLAHPRARSAPSTSAEATPSAAYRAARAGGTGFDGRPERFQLMSEAAVRINLLVSVPPVRRTNTGTREAAGPAEGCRLMRQA
jgi:hypothetical protein